MAEVRRRNTLLEGMVRLRKASPAINLTSAIVLFYIAENPGINVTELAELAHIETPTASRIVKALASPRSFDAEGGQARLVDVFDNVRDPRRRVLRLSPAGQELCAILETVISDAVPIGAQD